MHINRFLHAHLNDMARTNRFKVELHGPVIEPPAVEGEVEASPTNLGINSRGIRCTNVSLPGRTVSTENYKMHFSGPPRAHPSFVDYGGSVDLTFMLDTTYEDHQLISLWNSHIYDEVWGFRYPKEYARTVKIIQLDRRDWPIYEVDLQEAWPSAIAAIPLDSSQTNTIQTFTCTFQYRTWTSKYKNSPSGLLGGLFKKVERKIGSKIESEIEGQIFKKRPITGI